MARKTCFYKFPCHPAEIISSTPKSLSSSSRVLRMNLISMIADLSHTYSQAELDEKVYVDVNVNHEIIGFDLSELIGLNSHFSFGKRVKLGDLKEVHWIDMKFSN